MGRHSRHVHCSIPHLRREARRALRLSLAANARGNLREHLVDNERNGIVPPRRAHRTRLRPLENLAVRAVLDRQAVHQAVAPASPWGHVPGQITRTEHADEQPQHFFAARELLRGPPRPRLLLLPDAVCCSPWAWPILSKLSALLSSLSFLIASFCWNIFVVVSWPVLAISATSESFRQITTFSGLKSV